MATFAATVSRWSEGRKRYLIDVHRAVLGLIAHRLIHGSPVDTGRFKGNWKIGLGFVDLNEVDSLDKRGVATLNKIQRMIRMALPGGFVYFSNNVPYALRLEYGWSKQAPSGMVRITVMDGQTIVDEAERLVRRGAA